MYNLHDIFNGSHPFTESLQDYIDKELKQSEKAVILRPGLANTTHMNRCIDLKGKCFVLDEPLKLRKIDGLIISNGTVVAGPKFPNNKYLFHVVGANTIKFENLILDCTKRANGMFFNNFIRVRVEDCTIIHQLNYGIYGNEVGNNHELEVVKCNIMEYVFGDGVPNKAINEGIIPYFRGAKNRTSVGIFLGQADNVVADCNINLCKVGIKINMRANRIQGNHITAGNTDSNEIYNCIEIDKAVKTACIIVNNYIDNGRIYIRTSAKEIADRNYITITDNLCYRGFNHPKEKEFNHIFIDPIDKNSSFANVLIQSNQFYTQDANMEDATERKITPVGINESQGSIGSKRTFGSIMAGNTFTYSKRYKVMPQGTTLSQTVKVDETEKEMILDFEGKFPWGEITRFEFEGNRSPKGCSLKKTGAKQLKLINNSGFNGNLTIKVSVLQHQPKLDYFVH